MPRLFGAGAGLAALLAAAVPAAILAASFVDINAPYPMVLTAEGYNTQAGDARYYATAVDLTGNVVNGGRMGFGTLTLSPTVSVTAASAALLLTKYSPAGAALWAIASSSSNSEVYGQVRGVDTDAAGNVFAGGFYGGGPIQWGSLAELSNPSGENGMLLKTDPAGVPLWSISIADGSDVQVRDVATTPDGNVVAVGYQSNSYSIVTKYSGSDGSVIWSENISGGSNSYSRAYGVVVDKEGNIYVTGFFEDDDTVGTNNLPLTNPKPGGKSIYIIKYSSSGAAIFARAFASTFNTAEGAAITLGPDGALYVGGTFDGDHINQQPGNFTYLALGNIQVPGFNDRDAWVGKFDPAMGEPIWGTSMRGYNNEQVYALAVDGNNNVFAGGYTRSSSIFNDYTYNGQFAANIYATRDNDHAMLFVMDARSGAVRMANVYSKYEVAGCGSCDDSSTQGLAYNAVTGRMIMVGIFETSINFYPYVVTATYPVPANTGESAYFVQLASPRATSGIAVNMKPSKARITTGESRTLRVRVASKTPITATTLILQAPNGLMLQSVTPKARTLTSGTKHANTATGLTNTLAIDLASTNVKSGKGGKMVAKPQTYEVRVLAEPCTPGGTYYIGSAVSAGGNILPGQSIKVSVHPSVHDKKNCA